MATNQVAPLVTRLEGHTDVVNDVVYIPSTGAVISGSKDRTFGVWLKRENGKYWPSVWQQMTAQITSMAWDLDTRRLFVGLESGHIMLYTVTPDYNRVTPKRDFAAHKSRVTGIQFLASSDHLFSVSHDGCFQWFDAETGEHKGGYTTGSQCSALYYDDAEQRAFVGDYNGNIKVLSVADGRISLTTTLQGHHSQGGMLGPLKDSILSLVRGTVRSLAFDASSQTLFSGSFHTSITVWKPDNEDKPLLCELVKHNAKVRAVIWVDGAKKLISAAGDEIYVWDFTAKRKEAPKWSDENHCHACRAPFYFNFFKDWDYKTMTAKRQHHCRNCGCCFCDKCSKLEAVIPEMGYENNVRVCESCSVVLNEEVHPSLVTSYKAQHTIMSMMWMDETRQLLTTGDDNIIKIWDFENLVYTE